MGKQVRQTDGQSRTRIYSNNLGKDTYTPGEMAAGWDSPDDSPLKDSYLPGDSRWDKHERAIKVGLQQAIASGKLEIEDEVAKEFSLLGSREEVACV